MRRLGQHFLTDPAALRTIARALRPEDGVPIIEIGPGHGELTRELRRAYPTSPIIALEKDERLATALQKNAAHDASLEIILGDARELLPSLVQERFAPERPYAVAGNIPYYLTGYLFRLLEELSPRPTAVVLTIQKEVAERVGALPPHMNKLAASVQYWAVPKIGATIPKTSFRPAPEVDSATIFLGRRPKVGATRADYYALIPRLFAQPRKTILNNLGTYYKKEELRVVFDRLTLDPSLRPQDLTIATIEALANILGEAENEGVAGENSRHIRRT